MSDSIPPTQTDAPPVHKADILVIDDTPENLHLLSNMLTERHYKVRSVTKGMTGLRGAQAAPPDLILLDVNMPQMNGYEVCQQLKADDRTCEIPVIFISALGDVLDKVKAFQVGGVDYITKPFQVEEVFARIETHLTLRQLQKQLQRQNTQLQQEIRERQQAEEKFKKIFLSSPSPITITTLAEQRFVEVNPSFLQMSGYEQAEVIDQTSEQLQLGIAQESYNKAIQQILDVGSVHNQEFEFRTKSGDRKPVLLSIELIEFGNVSCALNIINDITERKRLENEFISLVSHELRTPMNSLIGALDLLSTGQLGELTDKGKQILEIATSNTERLIRLVNDILDLERMKSGKIAMRKTHCNLAELMTQAAEVMRSMADRNGIQLQIQPYAVEVWADADRLLQTLTNLLSNAIKFSEPGSTVCLTAELQPTGELGPIAPELGSAEAASSEPGRTDYLLIKVIDRGRGIPADKLQSIFERFQQVDASDSRKKGGTGLGLAICRNIVEQHDGRIWVESTLGQGSTFHVSLPLHPSPIHAPEVSHE
jgi:PAS domain S-box-containing protein